MIQTNHGINTASVRGSTHFFPGSGGGGVRTRDKMGAAIFFLVTLLGKFNYFEFSRGFFFGGGGLDMRMVSLQLVHVDGIDS